MNTLRNYRVDICTIDINKFCNLYNTVNILITQSFPKVYIYIYILEH